MPPLTEREFLAGAQAKVIPGRSNEQLINAISRVLTPVIDLTPQATLCEWSEATVTLTGVAKPTFVLPANGVDQTTIYHFIGVHNVTSGTVTVYKVDVEYPGLTDALREEFQIDSSDMFNMLSLESGSSGRATRGGRPLVVYPEGVLRVQRGSDAASGDTVRLQILRTVEGGCGRSSRLPGLITASEQ